MTNIPNHKHHNYHGRLYTLISNHANNDKIIGLNVNGQLTSTLNVQPCWKQHTEYLGFGMYTGNIPSF